MITAQTHCRGAAQFLLCKNTTSRVGKYCAVHCAYTAWLSSKQVRAVVGASPYTFVSIFFVAKSLAFFADFTLCYGIEKAVQSFSLRHRFVFGFLLFIRGYPYTSCPLPPILDSRQDMVLRLPDFRLHTQISDLPAR